MHREAKKQRLKIIRDIDQLKKGTTNKTEEEQLRKLEEDMAEYVSMRPIATSTQNPDQLLGSVSALSILYPKTPSILSSRTPRIPCGNSTSLSTRPTEICCTVL